MINKLILEKLKNSPNQALLLTILFGLENECDHSLFINCAKEFKTLRNLHLIQAEEGKTVLSHPFFERDAPKKRYSNPTKSINVKRPITVESWIKDWIELFPTKGKAGLTYSPRGDKVECIKRMKVFIKDYKYSKDEIFQATEYYLKEQKQRAWNYTKKAHKFIKDTNGSVLSEYCELMKDKPDNDINKFINVA